MEFFLVKDQRVVFDPRTIQTENNTTSRQASFHTIWEMREDTDKGRKVNSKLAADINNTFGSLLSGKTLELQVSIEVMSSNGTKVNKVRISEDVCIEKINSAAEKMGLVVEVVLVIKNWKRKDDQEIWWTTRASTDKIQMSGMKKDTISDVEWTNMMFSNVGYLFYWNNNAHVFEGELEIIITYRTIECGCPSSIELKELSQACRKLLTDDTGADISIVPRSGKSIKCHRALLLAYSDKFKNEIKGEFGDANSNFFKMPELTEDGVQALKDYMYLNDTAKAGQNCGVALELYSIAEKYEMKTLRDKMRDLLTTKPDNWYKGDMLMKFYAISKTANEDVHLKERVVNLIKANKHTVRSSEAFIQYMKDDPTGMIELLGLTWD